MPPPKATPLPGRVRPKVNVTLDPETFDVLAEIRHGNPDLDSLSAAIRWVVRHWKEGQKRPRKKS